MNDRDLLEQLLAEVKEISSNQKNMDKKLDSMDKRLSSLETRFSSLETRLSSLETRFSSLEEKLEVVNFKCDTNRKKIEDLSLDLKLFERDVKKDLKQLHDTTETLVVVLQNNGLLPQTL